ncbi:MAG: transposase [Aliifodinibius sp.]|nr:transposase [Fodinibius sp.]
MARAKRHYLPGQIWHLTHRCHKSEFLLKFAKDKRRYIQWLFKAKRRYGLSILNYTVTSNHIHLVVIDDGNRDTIARSIQLTAGRCAQEYNERKKRKGAYWQDRYHATAIETGKHLLRCLVYVDLNMVRAGAVKHPSEWKFGGYNEIQSPRRKCVLITYEKLSALAGYQSYEQFRKSHRDWVNESLAKGNNLFDSQWSRSIAVGSEQFVERIKAALGTKALGRRVHKASGGYELREPDRSYNVDFDSKKGSIGLKNTYKWTSFL